MPPFPHAESLREALDPAPKPVLAPGDRLAAVLAGFVEDRLVFIRRPDAMRHHPGQVAFPGGILNDDDPSLEAAALREYQEEVGGDPAAVRVLGALTPVHTVVSATLVVPFVGLIEGNPQWQPSVDEVDEVFDVPLDVLFDREREEEWERGGMRFTTYVYEVEGRTIWGATGHMLHDLLDVIRAVS